MNTWMNIYEMLWQNMVGLQWRADNYAKAKFFSLLLQLLTESCSLKEKV